MAAHNISSKLIEIFARKSAQQFLFPHITVIMNEGHDHLNKYQLTIQFSGVYHRTNFAEIGL